MNANENPKIIAPANTYCRLLPHFDLVLSLTYPIIRSNKAS